VLAGETPDSDNAEARVRLCGETAAGHEEKGVLDEDPWERCAHGKTGNYTWPISLGIDIYVDRRTTGCPQSGRVQTRQKLSITS